MCAKEFLLQECKNVQDLLAQTLRFEYGVDGSRDFFEECDVRLQHITDVLQSTSESDSDRLAAYGSYLNELARLICRIERSSLGEYSWPFVEELKKIATAICEEPSLDGVSTPPKIFVFADGGLDSYAIYPEERRPSITQRLLLTIVFPKSLKHFVLLHTILGHEIGHAIWRCSRHQQELRSRVVSVLKEPGSLFASQDAIERHLYSCSAPAEAKNYLSQIEVELGVKSGELFRWVDWEAWIEEILCDLIGLATFGPGFVGAHRELLYALDPSGVRFGNQHPPTAWRVNMILRAATILGFDAIPPGSHPAKKPLEKFWASMHAARKTDVWFDVFSDAQLRTTLVAIQALLNQHKPAPYVIADFDQVNSLLQQLVKLTPPVGFHMDTNDEPICISVDFRNIIYAGWVASRHDPKIPFDLINKLCEHAIMQQGAIEMSLQKAA